MLKNRVRYEKRVIKHVEFYRSWNRWRMQVTRSGVSGWLITGYFLEKGTAAELCESLQEDRGNPDFWHELDGFGVLLDRLQECPEEVQGMDSGLVLEAVEWLRNHQ